MIMATATSKLPRDTRAVRFDPDLAEALEELLQPFTGKALEKAQAAVVQVRRSGFTGGFTELRAEYERAIRAATAKG
jgi:hypothetical protein